MNNSLYKEVIYKNDGKDKYRRLEKEYYGNGNLKSEIRYKSGYIYVQSQRFRSTDEKDGLEKHYYENGVLKSEEIYQYTSDDLVYGKYYDENGISIKEIDKRNNEYKERKNGILIKERTKNVEKEYYEDGKIKLIKKDITKPAKVHYKNGQKAIEIQPDYNDITSKLNYYLPSGKMMCEVNFRYQIAISGFCINHRGENIKLTKTPLSMVKENKEFSEILEFVNRR